MVNKLIAIWNVIFGRPVAYRMVVRNGNGIGMFKVGAIIECKLMTENE